MRTIVFGSLLLFVLQPAAMLRRRSTNPGTGLRGMFLLRI